MERGIQNCGFRTMKSKKIVLTEGSRVALSKLEVGRAVVVSVPQDYNQVSLDGEITDKFRYRGRWHVEVQTKNTHYSFLVNLVRGAKDIVNSLNVTSWMPISSKEFYANQRKGVLA